MNKSLQILLSIFTIFLLSTSFVDGYCAPSSGSCQPPLIYSCNSNCCSEATDCGTGQFSEYTDSYQRAIQLKEDMWSFDSIINSALPYLFTIAGLVLFGMLIAGGFTMLTAATDPKKAEAGKTRITNAVVGFIIIFVAYWLTQILEIILGVKIL